MTDVPTQAPDLLDGYVIVGTNVINSWRTDVCCVLQRRKDGITQRSVLSQECRAEAVGVPIFQGALYEFCVADTWDGTVMLRGGSYQHGFRAIEAQSVHQPSSLANKVHCPDRSIRVLDFDEALHFVRAGDSNHLYLSLSWQDEDGERVLFAPCRYTNFPNEALTTERYIQPISGYVLHETKGRFAIAYAAAHVSPGGQTRIEFIRRLRLPFLDTKPNGSFMQKIMSTILRATVGRFLWTDEFHSVDARNGRALFYIYQ